MFDGTLEQCENFKTYIDTKFIRFFVALGLCASSIRNQETQRFVPDSSEFEHIFTDDKLYKKY